MIRLLLILVAFPISFSAQTAIQLQEQTTSPISVSGRYIGTDNLDQHYFISNNVLQKIVGNVIVEFKKVAAGNITRVDIQNPLLIMVFYQGYNSIVLLDNQLNEVREINFSRLNGDIVAHAAGLASQNRLWIYDSVSQQVLLFDYLKNESRSLATAFRYNIRHYQNDFNNFFWIDEQNNSYSIDIYGKIKTLGKVPDFETISLSSVSDGFISRKGQLYYYNFKENNGQFIDLGINSARGFHFNAQKLSIFTEAGITNYKIILP